MKHDFSQKSITELCDLLADKTMELLKLIEKKKDGLDFQDLKGEVQELQKLIKAHRHKE